MSLWIPAALIIVAAGLAAIGLHLYLRPDDDSPLFRVQPGLPALPVDLPSLDDGYVAGTVIDEPLDDEDAQTLAWLTGIHEQLAADDDVPWVTAQVYGELVRAVLDDPSDPEWAMRREAMAADVSAFIAAQELDTRRYLQALPAASRPDDQVPVLTRKVVGKRRPAEVAS